MGSLFSWWLFVRDFQVGIGNDIGNGHANVFGFHGALFRAQSGHRQGHFPRPTDLLVRGIQSLAVGHAWGRGTVPHGLAAVAAMAHRRKIGGAAAFRQAGLGLVGLGGFHVGRRGDRQSHLFGPADLLVNAGHGGLEWNGFDAGMVVAGRIQ